MKCPWCNADLKDGTVLCSICGNEINMVPDFEPEIEDQCRETIETMTKDIFSTGEKQKSSPEGKKCAKEVNGNSKVQNNLSSQEKLNIDKSDESNKEKAPKFILFILIFVALIIAAVVTIIIVTSDSYKLSQAQKAYSAHEYDKSKTLYQGLLEKNPDDVDLLVEYSYVLFDSNDLSEYENVLFEIINNSDSSEDLKIQTYQRLIYIYSGNKEYSKIRDLIIESKNTTILEKYNDYLTYEPEIVLASGNYSTSQMISINSNYDVYYSLINEFNGETTVIADNELYRLPILIEIGTYKLTAYTKNKYGLSSDTVEAEYTIEVAPPIEPELSLAEGTYISPQLLEVYYDSDNITVYFTTDGSDPGPTSQIYNGSIVVPSGYNTYSFVAVDEYGLKSKVVSISVNIEYQYEIQPGTALDLLINYLLEKGTIVSYDGTMPDGGNLNFILSGFEAIDDNYCYIFEETMMVDGVASYLDVQYSVDMITGEVAKID